MKVKLKADAEVDFLTHDELVDALTPQINLLMAIRDLLETSEDAEAMTHDATFPIAVTGADGTFSTPIFHCPQGYRARLHLITLSTPLSTLAYGGAALTTPEAVGPVSLRLGSATVAGPLVAVFAGATTAGIGWTWGRAQAPIVEAGTAVWAVGRSVGSTTTPPATTGVAHVQYELRKTQGV